MKGKQTRKQDEDNAAFITFLRELTTAIYDQHFLVCKMLQKPAGRVSSLTPAATPTSHSLKDEAFSFGFLELGWAIQ